MKQSARRSSSTWHPKAAGFRSIVAIIKRSPRHNKFPSHGKKECFTCTRTNWFIDNGSNLFPLQSLPAISFPCIVMRRMATHRYAFLHYTCTIQIKLLSSLFAIVAGLLDLPYKVTRLPILVAIKRHCRIQRPWAGIPSRCCSFPSQHRS